MKKLITAVAILICGFTNAQIKEGSISYIMNIEGLPPEQAAMMGDMETKVYFKENKSLTEMNSMMMNSKALSDDNGNLFLMDQMGNKSFIRTSKAELDKNAEVNKDKEPKIEYTSETKTIAGYECKKANVTIMTQKNEEFKTEVWYTEKITYIRQGGGRKGGEMFKGLKGLPMEYMIPQGPMKIKMTAKEVSLEAVPDSKFVLTTEGYTEMKMEDLKKQQGGTK
jgi:GLPGLI family protein